MHQVFAVVVTFTQLDMIIRFAEMETKLGEIDRARAIYSHASQMCDPRVTAEFWQVGGGQTTPALAI